MHSEMHVQIRDLGPADSTLELFSPSVVFPLVLSHLQ